MAILFYCFCDPDFENFEFSKKIIKNMDFEAFYGLRLVSIVFVAKNCVERSFPSSGNYKKSKLFFDAPVAS